MSRTSPGRRASGAELQVTIGRSSLGRRGLSSGVLLPRRGAQPAPSEPSRDVRTGEKQSRGPPPPPAPGGPAAPENPRPAGGRRRWPRRFGKNRSSPKARGSQPAARSRPARLGSGGRYAPENAPRAGLPGPARLARLASPGGAVAGPYCGQPGASSWDGARPGPRRPLGAAASPDPAPCETAALARLGPKSRPGPHRSGLRTLGWGWGTHPSARRFGAESLGTPRCPRPPPPAPQATPATWKKNSENVLHLGKEYPSPDSEILAPTFPVPSPRPEPRAQPRPQRPPGLPQPARRALVPRLLAGGNRGANHPGCIPGSAARREPQRGPARRTPPGRSLPCRDYLFLLLGVGPDDKQGRITGCKGWI